MYEEKPTIKHRKTNWGKHGRNKKEKGEEETYKRPDK